MPAVTSGVRISTMVVRTMLILCFARMQALSMRKADAIQTSMVNLPSTVTITLSSRNCRTAATALCSSASSISWTRRSAKSKVCLYMPAPMDTTMTKAGKVSQTIMSTPSTAASSKVTLTSSSMQEARSMPSAIEYIRPTIRIDGRDATPVPGSCMGATLSYMTRTMQVGR